MLAFLTLMGLAGIAAAGFGLYSVGVAVGAASRDPKEQ